MSWQQSAVGLHAENPIEKPPVGTDWPKGPIWLRRTFYLAKTDFTNPQLLPYYNRAKVELYLSSQRVAAQGSLESNC